MFPGAKIIAVDDEPKELGVIVSTLRSLGLACIAYNYPDELPDENISYSGVRVIFLDINLIGGTSPGSDTAIFNAPMSILERLLTDHNGPYALITWSSTTLHDTLIEKISQSATLSDRQPFYARALSKAEYAEDKTRLKLEVEKIFKEHPPFGALLDWESRVARAGEAVLRDLNKLASSLSGKSASERMDQLLSRLAVAAFGAVNAEDHRFEAVNEALFEALEDALKSQFSSTPPGKLWENAITKCSLKTALSGDTTAKLNSAMLLELASGIKPYRRGAILEVPARWLSDREFKRKFGGTCLGVSAPLKLGDSIQPKWVLIQIQAACDFSQPKIAPIPYLLGAIVPATVRNGAMPDSIFLTPAFAPAAGFSPESFKIAVCLGTPRPIARSTLDRGTFTVLGRLRDHLVESIAYGHHSHGSRPGFISF